MAQPQPVLAPRVDSPGVPTHPSQRVLVQTGQASSAWLDDLLGFRPMVRQLVSEPWQVLDALADGGFDLVVVDADSLVVALRGLQLVACARTAGAPTPFVLVTDACDVRLRALAAPLVGVSFVQRRAGRGVVSCWSAGSW
jgi:hypothetical protein